MRSTQRAWFKNQKLIEMIEMPPCLYTEGKRGNTNGEKGIGIEIT